MGVLTTLFFFHFFFQGAISIGPLTIFGTLGMPPIEAPLWTPIAKLKKCIDLDFSLYTEEFNFGQTIWDKTHVLLRTS
jgi:hypothetical protein